MTDTATDLSPLPERINSNAVTKILGISRAQVLAMARDGKLPHYRVGTRIVFDRTEITDWMNAQRVTV